MILLSSNKSTKMPLQKTQTKAY